MARIDGDETLKFASQKEFVGWLETKHSTSPGIWLKIAKKGSKDTTITNKEALETALCYGWIDSIRRGLDEDYFLQRYSPRSRKSIWSKINREHVKALIKSGKMKPSGLAEMERAKADGRWEAAYEGQAGITEPKDFMDALKKNKQAAKIYKTLNSVNRYAILFRIHTAKKPETRAARIEKFIAMLAKGERLHP